MNRGGVAVRGCAFVGVSKLLFEAWKSRSCCFQLGCSSSFLLQLAMKIQESPGGLTSPRKCWVHLPRSRQDELAPRYAVGEHVSQYLASYIHPHSSCDF